MNALNLYEALRLQSAKESDFQTESYVGVTMEIKRKIIVIPWMKIEFQFSIQTLKNCSSKRL